MAFHEPAHFSETTPGRRPGGDAEARDEVLELAIAFTTSVPAALIITLTLACFFGRHLAWVVGMTAFLSFFLCLYHWVTVRIAREYGKAR